MKECFRCQEVKALSEYYRHPHMGDGHLNKCKSCTKADSRKHREEKLLVILEYNRQRGQLQHRKEAVKRRAPKYNRQRDNEIMREKYPDQRRARTALSNAVRDGKIEKPTACQNCGTKGRLHGHHHDYSKPLDVQWLCVDCHGAIHRAENEARRIEENENAIAATLGLIGAIVLTRQFAA